MPTLKQSPNELSIHGGGPPALESALPAFSPNVGDGKRFSQLAERMFLQGDVPGTLVEEFENAVTKYTGARNAVGFASAGVAAQCVLRCFRGNGHLLVPALGHGFLPMHAVMGPVGFVDSGSFKPGVCIDHLSRAAKGASLVFGIHAHGDLSSAKEVEELCDDMDVPLCFFGHQSFGSSVGGKKSGRFGRAEIIELGRDQLVYGLDSAIVVTDDDLIAHRLRSVRASKIDGLSPLMSDASAAMAIANLERSDDFIAANRARYERYRQGLSTLTGMRLLPMESGYDPNYQSVVIEIDPRISGITRDSVYDVLAAENIGASKPFAADGVMTTYANAQRFRNSLLQLPSGPASTDEVIEAVCRTLELAIVRSLESPDPIQLAA